MCPAARRGSILGACHALWRTMSCEPSSLISAIHRNLPYFTNNPFEGVNLTNATITVDNILEDLLVVQYYKNDCQRSYSIFFSFPACRSVVWYHFCCVATVHDSHLGLLLLCMCLLLCRREEAHHTQSSPRSSDGCHYCGLHVSTC